MSKLKRFVVRDFGAALAVLSVYFLMLLAPLHQAAASQSHFADLGYRPSARYRSARRSMRPMPQRMRPPFARLQPSANRRCSDRRFPPTCRHPISNISSFPSTGRRCGIIRSTSIFRRHQGRHRRSSDPQAWAARPAPRSISSPRCHFHSTEWPVACAHRCLKVVPMLFSDFVADFAPRSVSHD